VEFYKVFGGEEIAAAHFCGPQYATTLGLESADFDMRMLQFGDVLLELLCYATPTPRPYSVRNCDVGAAHLAFQVDNILGVYATFSEMGIRSFAPPLMIEEGDFAGGYFVYLKDPDGLPVELIQMPPQAAVPA
jgi:catechol 2,3-dioxygenase-like lactoylglutathione lyase family enzyme